MRNSASTVVASRCLSVGLAFLTLTVTARALGPNGRGVAATAISILLLAPIILSFGMPSAIRRAFATKTLANARADLRSARLVAIPTGILAAGATSLVSAQVLPEVESHMRAIIVVGVGVCTATGLVWLNDSSALIGSGRVGAYAIVLLIPSATMAISIVGLIVSNRVSVNAVVISQVVSYPVTCIVSMLLVAGPVTGSISSVRSIFGSAVPFAASQISEALAYRLDQVLVLGVVGAYGAGLYSVATTISMLPSVIGLAVATTSFQRISAEAKVGGQVDPRWARLAVMAVIPAIVLLGCLSPLAIPLVFGHEFKAAVIPTLIGLVGCLPLVALQAANSMLVALNRGWRISIAQVSGLACGIALLYALGPRWGPEGAALASTIGFTISAVIALAGAGFRPRDLAPKMGDASAIMVMFSRGIA